MKLISNLFTELKGRETMKAGVLEELMCPLAIKEVPVPEYGTKDILIKVKQCGICVTDVRIATGARPVGELPFIMGHEGLGVVEETGTDVSQFQRGQRVLMNPLISCGMCDNCSVGRDNLCEHRRLIGISPGVQGVYAEYAVIPERNLYTLPDEISDSDGVLITSNLASAFHGVRRVDFKASETACIYGVGAIGKLLILILKAFGASLIIGVSRSEKTVRAAGDFGPDYMINSTEEDPVEKIKELTKGKGVDVAFEAAGKQEAIMQALSSTKIGGRTCILGVPFYRVVMDFGDQLGFFNEVSQKEATIVDAWGYTRQEFPMMINMVQKGLINFSPCTTKIIPLEEVNEGLRLNQEGLYSRVIIGF